MKAYLLFCFYAIVTSTVDSNNLEYQNSQYVASNLHNDFSNIAREGNSNSLNRYNLGERNSNLLMPTNNYNLVRNNLLREGNSNNLNLVNTENYPLPNDLLREGNSNYLNSKNNNLLRYNLLNVGRERKSNNLNRLNLEKSNIMPDNLDLSGKQGTASSGNPELIDVQSTDNATLYSADDLDAVIENYLGNPGLEQEGASKPSDVPQFESRFGFPGFGGFGGGGFGGKPGLGQDGSSKPSDTVPQFESRFGFPGFGGFGGGGFGGGAGIGGGIGAGIGISAGIGASIGAGAGAFGYGGMGGYGVPGYGFPGAGGFGFPGFG